MDVLQCLRWLTCMCVDFCFEQVSGNHRLDDNKAERLRCEEAGREVSSSAVEGRPVGPLRVWPGGLNMSRTIGDYEVRCACTNG